MRLWFQVNKVCLEVLTNQPLFLLYSIRNPQLAQLPAAPTCPETNSRTFLSYLHLFLFQIHSYMSKMPSLENKTLFCCISRSRPSICDIFSPSNHNPTTDGRHPIPREASLSTALTQAQEALSSPFLLVGLQHYRLLTTTATVRRLWCQRLQGGRCKVTTPNTGSSYTRTAPGRRKLARLRVLCESLE